MTAWGGESWRRGAGCTGRAGGLSLLGMRARFRSTCADCKSTITPGQDIIVRGRGDTIHAVCPGATGQRIVEFRFSTGATMTRNARGTCIDAPCCGCCTF